MAEAQQTLWLDVLVGNDTHQCRHKDADNTLDGIEPGYLITQSGNSKIVSHTGEISTPYGKLNKIQQRKTEFHIHLLFSYWFNDWFIIFLLHSHRSFS